jgi:hypothetical protein
MTASLQETLLTEQNAAPIVADVQALVEQQLASKGPAAAGVKVAYKAITAFAPGYYQQIVGAMLPGIVTQLDPFWSDFTASGGSSFGDYLAKRGDEVSQALLSVTDDMARGSDKKAVVKAYGAVRGGAVKHVEAALPSLGALVQKYMSLRALFVRGTPDWQNHRAKDLDIGMRSANLPQFAGRLSEVHNAFPQREIAHAAYRTR